MVNILSNKAGMEANAGSSTQFLQPVTDTKSRKILKKYIAYSRFAAKGFKGVYLPCRNQYSLSAGIHVIRENG
jgi:hypothetical protein